MTEHLSSLSLNLVSIAEQAGQAILNIYQQDDFQEQIKSDNSPLTAADLASHNLIVEQLQQLTPEIPILSEESANIPWEERKTWNKYWLIDPLDGTKEFIKRNGEFTVNIALIENHQPILGVVHAPILNQTWCGEQGKPAIKITNGKTETIQVKPHQQGETWKVVGSRSHAGDSLKHYLQELGEHELISMGSSIKLCLVAEGKAHIYPRLGPTSEWDTAAAHAVVNAASGRIINHKTDQPLRYNSKEDILNPWFIVNTGEDLSISEKSEAVVCGSASKFTHMSTSFKQLFEESVKTKQSCIEQGFQSLEAMGNQITQSIQSGNKLMLCGNGGSAADAQHLAAEMLVRLRPKNNREGIPAIALAQDTSTITACGNDFGYDQLYERVVTSLGKEGDCLIGITTSGNSENVIKAMKVAKGMKIKVYGFLGAGGGEALRYCDEAFVVPSDNTGRIQEVHITAGHALMEYIEDRLIESGYIHLEGGQP